MTGIHPRPGLSQSLHSDTLGHLLYPLILVIAKRQGKGLREGGVASNCGRGNLTGSEVRRGKWEAVSWFTVLLSPVLRGWVGRGGIQDLS